MAVEQKANMETRAILLCMTDSPRYPIANWFKQIGRPASPGAAGLPKPRPVYETGLVKPVAAEFVRRLRAHLRRHQPRSVQSLTARRAVVDFDVAPPHIF
jgi:hypothetical protein